MTHGLGLPGVRGSPLVLLPWLQYEHPFGLAQLFPGAWREAPKGQAANADANQAQGRVADGCGHAADLPILSLDQFQ